MVTKVLILGGTSYVAQFLCAHFLTNAVDETVQVACTIRASSPQDLPPPLTLATTVQASDDTRRIHVFSGVSMLNLTTVETVVNAYDPTVIINCIALSSPAACERDPETAQALNYPTQLISFLCDRKKPVHYIHFSTDFVYDGHHVPLHGYREEDAVVSTDHCVYSATKLAFDQYLLASTTLDITILRIANVIGGPAPLFPHQSPKFAQWLYTELVGSPKKQSTSVRLWKDEIRSFVYVEDLVRVVRRLIVAPHPIRLLNVGGLDALSRVEFAEQFLRALDPRVKSQCRSIEPCARASVDLGYQTPLDARLDCSKLHDLFPDIVFTSTEEIMHELSRVFQTINTTE